MLENNKTRLQKAFVRKFFVKSTEILFPSSNIRHKSCVHGKFIIIEIYASEIIKRFL